MTTFFELIKEGENILTQAGHEHAYSDAQQLCCVAFDKTAETLLRDLRDPIPNTKHHNQFHAMITKRAMGSPLQYITQSAHFLGDEIAIQPGVFIPRPETEELVSVMVEKLTQWNLITNPITILECGFGSGIISITLAKHCPSARIIAWDKNPLAYETAIKNAENQNIDTIEWRLGDFFDGVTDISSSNPMIIVSNPPYIPEQDIQTLDPTVKDFEPHLALNGGADGLAYYKQLSEVAATFNCPLICEIGVDQQAPLEQILNEKQWGTDFRKDLQGIPRVCIGIPKMCTLNNR